MTLFRYLVCAAFASVLVAGCNQSLFDASPDDEGERADGSIGVPDASVEPDAGGPRPDAGFQESCPQPCVGDAVADFSTEQNERWRYTEVVLDLDGLPLLRDMVYSTWSTLAAWSGATAPPAIVSCPAHAGATECLGVADKLLLVPTGSDPGAPQPALVWSAPHTGSFRLAADWRVPEGSTPGSSRSLVIARNGLFDGVYTTSFLGSITPRALDIEVDAVLEDTIALSVVPGDNTNVPLGLSLYVTDLGRNDDCQMTFPFDVAQAPFDNSCGDASPLVEGGVTPTQDIAPPPGIPGRARSFSGDSSLQYQGPSIDYSGDWTLQFWAAIDGSGDVLSDQTCVMTAEGYLSGGIAIRFEIESMFVSIGDEVTNRDCGSGSGPGVIAVSVGPDFDDEKKWHLYRVVRNKSAETVTVCVDGKYRDAPGHVITMPSAATMRTERRLDLGHGRDSASGSFTGKLADLRVYDRALPCTRIAP